MDKVKEQVKNKRQWLETQMQAYRVSPKQVDPPVTTSQTRAEAKVYKLKVIVLHVNDQVFHAEANFCWQVEVNLSSYEKLERCHMACVCPLSKTCMEWQNNSLFCYLFM